MDWSGTEQANLRHQIHALIAWEFLKTAKNINAFKLCDADFSKLQKSDLIYKHLTCKGILMPLYFSCSMFKDNFCVRSSCISGGSIGGSLEPPSCPPFFNILWKWNNLVSQRPNYFIFLGYLRKMSKNQQK